MITTKSRPAAAACGGPASCRPRIRERGSALGASRSSTCIRPNGSPTSGSTASSNYLRQLNRRHSEERAGDSELEARIASYELAFRMQSNAPEAVDISQETAATQRAYGLDDPVTSTFGRNCLMARRLVERGVRFVQLYSGSGSKLGRP